MLQLTDAEWDMLTTMLPERPVSAKGGRPPINPREAVAGIFWIRDNGAKWKDLPAGFGSKSAVHRRFARWVKRGAFEALLAAMGSIVKERKGFKLYECDIDGTFSRAKGGGDGAGCTKGGKGVKSMIMVDAQGRPIAVNPWQRQSTREHPGRAAL